MLWSNLFYIGLRVNSSCMTQYSPFYLFSCWDQTRERKLFSLVFFYPLSIFLCFLFLSSVFTSRGLLFNPLTMFQTLWLQNLSFGPVCLHISLSHCHFNSQWSVQVLSMELYFSESFTLKYHYFKFATNLFLIN